MASRCAAARDDDLVAPIELVEAASALPSARGVRRVWRRRWPRRWSRMKRGDSRRRRSGAASGGAARGVRRLHTDGRACRCVARAAARAAAAAVAGAARRHRRRRRRRRRRAPPMAAKAPRGDVCEGRPGDARIRAPSPLAWRRTTGASTSSRDRGGCRPGDTSGGTGRGAQPVRGTCGGGSGGGGGAVTWAWVAAGGEAEAMEVGRRDCG